MTPLVVVSRRRDLVRAQRVPIVWVANGDKRVEGRSQVVSASARDNRWPITCVEDRLTRNTMLSYDEREEISGSSSLSVVRRCRTRSLVWV